MTDIGRETKDFCDRQNLWEGQGTKRRTETFRRFRPNGSPETVSQQQTTGKYRPKAAKLRHSSPSADWWPESAKKSGGAGSLERTRLRVNSLLNRENTGNFFIFWPILTFQSHFSAANSMGWRQIP